MCLFDLRVYDGRGVEGVVNRYKEVIGRKKRLAYTLDNTLSHMLKEENSRQGPGAIPENKASFFICVYFFFFFK